MEWKNIIQNPRKNLKIPEEEGLTIIRPFSLQWRVLKVNFVLQDPRVTKLEAGIRNITDKQINKKGHF